MASTYPSSTNFSTKPGASDSAATAIDVAYLAYCCWPLAASHELGRIAADAGIETNTFTAHDAGDDAVLTVEVLNAAAHTVRGWDDELTDIIAAAGQSSAIWKAVFGIAGIPFIAAVLDAGDTADNIAGLLTGRNPIRTATGPAGVFQVAGGWRGSDGRVDPHLLAEVGHPGAPGRDPQSEMADEIAAAVLAGVDIAIEAATGTGKSLAALAAALDWIDGVRTGSRESPRTPNNCNTSSPPMSMPSPETHQGWRERRRSSRVPRTG